MRKLPAIILATLAIGVGYLSCTDPKFLEPHDPRLTPSLTATEGSEGSDTPASATSTPTLAPTVTNAISATATDTPTPTQTYTPTATDLPTERPTPTRIGTLRPVPSVPPSLPTSHIVEVTQEDIDALARLCVVEVRGMEEVRDEACLSVVSTVLTRAYNFIISDGTVAGTIGWNCTAESDTCQFPAHVLASGCDGITPAACSWNYPEDIANFQTVVREYFEGRGGPCDGYVYYGITAQDPPECRIESSSGQFLNWHGKVH